MEYTKGNESDGKWKFTGSRVRGKDKRIVFFEPQFQHEPYISEANGNRALIESSPLMFEAIKLFVERVEKGEIRSKKTYSQFKSIIEGMKP